MSKVECAINFDPIDLVRQRLRQNQNALIALTGQTGSGKSMCSLELARRIDPDFTADQVVFKITDFLALLEPGVLEKGRAIVFDEAGVEFDARRSSSKGNVGFSNVLKVYRYLQIPTIFTLPRLTMLDINARRLFHYWLKTAGIDYNRNLCKTHWFHIDSEDDWGDRIKRYFPRVIDRDTGERATITWVKFPMPPKKLVDAYEKRKDEFVQTMLTELGDALRKSQRGDGDEPSEPVPGPEPELSKMDLEMLESVAKHPPAATVKRRPKNVVADPFMAGFEDF